MELVPPSPHQKPTRWLWLEQRSFNNDFSRMSTRDLEQLFCETQNGVDRVVKDYKFHLSAGTIAVLGERVVVTITFDYPIKTTFRTSAHVSKHPIRALTSKIFKYLNYITEAP